MISMSVVKYLGCNRLKLFHANINVFPVMITGFQKQVEVTGAINP